MVLGLVRLGAQEAPATDTVAATLVDQVVPVEMQAQEVLTAAVAPAADQAVRVVVPALEEMAADQAIRVEADLDANLYRKTG